MASDDVEHWDRQFAAGFYNQTWDLLEKSDRTPADDDDLLALAFASRAHWGRLEGTVSERAIGDQHIARVCAALGRAELAVKYANQALAVTLREGWNDFRLAAAHETVARAAAAAGDREVRDRHIALATDALALIDEPDDRAVIEAQISTVP